MFVVFQYNLNLSFKQVFNVAASDNIPARCIEVGILSFQPCKTSTSMPVSLDNRRLRKYFFGRIENSRFVLHVGCRVEVLL